MEEYQLKKMNDSIGCIGVLLIIIIIILLRVLDKM